VAEANQVLIFNAGESYRISHPIAGGDACLSVSVAEEWAEELTPSTHLVTGAPALFARQRLRIDARTQALVATLRHSLHRGVAEPLEAETLTLTLVRCALGEHAANGARASAAQRRLVDRVKLLLSSDLARRWTLAQIAHEIGRSPVYLTQLFQRFEGMPLYRYQLRLRLASALDRLDGCDDLSRLSMDLGFSSHSHFTAAFRQAYGQTPVQLQRALRLR
jgi:AraC-like DNA-binding protein